MSFFKKVCAFVAASTLGVAATANAASISYGPTTFDNGGLNYSAGAGGSFNFPQFDTSLGSLTSVVLNVTGYSFGGTNNYDNETGSAGEASVSIGSDITVTGPSALVVLTQPINTATGEVAADSDAAPDYVGDDSLSVTGTNSVDNDSSSIFAGFAPYEGLGNVTFNFTSNANGSYTGPLGATFPTASPTFYFVADITYNYNPVPEPTTLAMAGLGLVGLVGLARRRRR